MSNKEIDEEMSRNIHGEETGSMSMTYRGGYGDEAGSMPMTYCNDYEPIDAKKGDKFIHIDTKEVSIHNGCKFVKIEEGQDRNDFRLKSSLDDIVYFLNLLFNEEIEHKLLRKSMVLDRNDSYIGSLWYKFQKEYEQYFPAGFFKDLKIETQQDISSNTCNVSISLKHDSSFREVTHFSKDYKILKVFDRAMSLSTTYAHHESQIRRLREKITGYEVEQFNRKQNENKLLKRILNFELEEK